MILCLDSAHSAEKLGQKYPFVNDSVLEVLYGFRMEPGTVQFLGEIFSKVAIEIFGKLCQVKSHTGLSGTLIPVIFQSQNLRIFTELLTKLI